MKNNLHLGAWRSFGGTFFKLCLFLLLIFCVPSYALAQKVSLKYTNAKLGQIMEDITRQSNLSFAYSREVVDVDRVVSINVSSDDIHAVLSKLFTSSNVEYRIADNKIYLCAKQSGSGITVNATITGKIIDDSGTPMIGVAVVLKGSNTGVISEVGGNFKLRVDATNPVLQFSFIGYETLEVSLNSSQTVVNVTMRDSATKIKDVIVTALGITREEKSLGYAVTKIDNETLNATVSSNWLNALSGKVAGLNFDNASAGPGGSMRVTLRGESSLSHDKNAALFVIDGIPVNSDMAASNSGAVAFNTDAPIDYGNGASDINPEDIESISVLKGPSATALYGSRAANGAIIITTKSGHSTKGLGVTINSSITFEKAGFWPDFQKEYGAGKADAGNLIQERYYNYWSVPATAAEDGIAATGRVWARVAFGPKFDGQMFYQYESRNWETGMYKKLPWQYNEDWYKGFFETGVTFNNSVSIENGNGKGNSLRVSIKDTRNEWIIPNTGYRSQNVNFSIVQKIGKSMTFDGRVTYYRKDSDNLPMSGYNNASPLYTLIWSPNVIGTDSYWREYKNGRIKQMNEENTTSQLINSSGGDNLYLQVYEQLNTLDRDRVYGNIKLSIDLMEGLSLSMRSGMDFSNDFRTQQKPWYSANYQFGYYKEQTVRTFEVNSDFLLSYNRKMGEFGISTAFGGNNMFRNYQSVQLTAKDGLLEDGIYTMANARQKPLDNPYRNGKSINSFYGFVNLSWRDMLFLDLTARNDWSSTLPKGNNSYFYPSVSLSFLLNEALDFRNNLPWVNLLKIRGSWANVGNDTDPYQIMHRYTTGNFAAGFYLPGSIQNSKLKPENIESFEMGVEASLFNNRWSFDATYYHATTTNQIIGIPVDQATGATSKIINAGKVRNEGIEFSTRIQPLKTKDWNWTISANWTKNWNKLIELAPGVDLWRMNSSMTISGNIFIDAYPGSELGRIYGRGFERAPKDAFYIDENGKKVNCGGEVIVTQNDGYPQLTATDNLLDHGSIYPKWKAGMSHALSYKNLKLSMAFSGQWGGNTYSVTHFGLAYQGKLKNSLKGRYAGLVHSGVNRNADGTYQKNTTIIANVYDYYDKYMWSRENVENNTFDTSFLKLKEVRIDYSLPKKMLEKIKFLQGVSIGAYATNLFCWTNFPLYDPEAGATVGSSIVKGIEAGAYPLTRTYGFNLKLNF